MPKCTESACEVPCSICGKPMKGDPRAEVSHGKCAHGKCREAREKFQSNPNTEPSCYSFLDIPLDGPVEWPEELDSPDADVTVYVLITGS